MSLTSLTVMCWPLAAIAASNWGISFWSICARICWFSSSVTVMLPLVELLVLPDEADEPLLLQAASAATSAVAPAIRILRLRRR
jgi:hypothetical protein